MGFIRSAVVHTREGITVECVVTEDRTLCPIWLREGDTLQWEDLEGRLHFLKWPRPDTINFYKVLGLEG